MTLLLSASCFVAGILAGLYIEHGIMKGLVASHDAEKAAIDQEREQILQVMVECVSETERAIEAYNHYSYLAEQLKLSQAHVDARQEHFDQEVAALRKEVLKERARGDEMEKRWNAARSARNRKDK
jgi:hypothetical protein